MEMWSAILESASPYWRMVRPNKQLGLPGFKSRFNLLLELRFWLSRSRWFWRGRRLLWLELADVTMDDMQDAKV